MIPKENFRSTLVLNEKMTEMETLAWASMSEEELIEKLSHEAWRGYKPKRESYAYGEVGASLGKADRYVAKYAIGYSRKKRRKIATEVFSRAKDFFDNHCMKWTEEVLYAAKSSNTDWPPSKSNLRTIINERVPLGARQEVYRIVARKLRWGE